MLAKFFAALLVVAALAPVEAGAVAGREAIRMKITSQLDDVKACYHKILRTDIDVYGKVVVDFEINDKGRVTKAAVAHDRSTLKHRKLSKCITEKFKAWKFPPAVKGQTVAVSYPLVFSAR